VSYETNFLGPAIAKNLKAHRPKAFARWHLDEMVVSPSGRQMHTWRAVDGEGEAHRASGTTSAVSENSDFLGHQRARIAIELTRPRSSPARMDEFPASTL
jgi:hypothetical protein